MLQFPTSKHLKRILNSNSIKNCPILPRDVDVADQIFGPDVAAMKGRTTKSSSELVPRSRTMVPYKI